ncbi:hypothetical protein ERJ75_001280800 [Trypanosoma vivax]|nr:hypothetical protein ERJ75_001280800 [Trypanosoma vivax]
MRQRGNDERNASKSESEAGILVVNTGDEVPQEALRLRRPQKEKKQRYTPAGEVSRFLRACDRGPEQHGGTEKEARRDGNSESGHREQAEKGNAVEKDEVAGQV